MIELADPFPVIVASVTGLTIIGGGYAEDGIHFELSDGRMLVVTAIGAIFVGLEYVGPKEIH